MTKFVKYIFIFVLVGIISCNEPSKENAQQIVIETAQTKSLPPFNLVGQFYFAAPELDSVHCKSTGACDCCASGILFLSDSTFLYVAYCLQDDTYFKGTYKINNDEVVFYSDKLRIDILTDITVDSSNSVSDTTHIETHYVQKAYTFKWKEFLCKDKICFVDEEDTLYAHYAIPAPELKENFITTIKKDSIWYKLGLD